MTNLQQLEWTRIPDDEETGSGTVKIYYKIVWTWLTINVEDRSNAEEKFEFIISDVLA